MFTPLDIQNKKFGKSAVGYNKDEVDSFMEMLLRDYEKLYKDAIDANDRINVLSSAIEHYKSIEQTMQNTLIVAQSTSEDVLKNAEEKAKIIVSEAEVKASQIVSEAETNAANAARNFESLKQSMELFKARMVGMLSAQIESLKSDNE